MIVVRKIHELKTWKQFFQDVLDGDKPFEVRKDDRDFRVGDDLYLREFDPETLEYTGRAIHKLVTYKLTHEEFAGVAEGYCVMGLISLPKVGGITEYEQ